MRGFVDKAMAITAIHPELRDMQIMREGHRLDRLITAVRPQTMATPQTAIFSGSQFAQRGKKFAIVLSELCFREGPVAKIKTAQSCG